MSIIAYSWWTEPASRTAHVVPDGADGRTLCGADRWRLYWNLQGQADAECSECRRLLERGVPTWTN